MVVTLSFHNLWEFDTVTTGCYLNLKSGQYKVQKWTGGFLKIDDLKLKRGQL